MSLLVTSQSLIDQVRSQLDEQNQDSVDSQKDIIPSLNRAQDYAFDILARLYPEPLLDKSALVIVGDQAEYEIPEEIFEDRVLKIEMAIPSGAARQTYREVQRISYRDITDFESSSKTNIPYYYAIYGRTIRFVPTPTGTYSARMWYLRNVEKLALPQGRITLLNQTSNYVIVDSVGDSLTTESDQLGSYVNIIDGQTGEIKGSLQIQTLTDNKILFRTVPTRSSVLNRTILGDLSLVNLQQDDYLAPIDGTCVPYYGRPVTNFLIQFAVSEITRKLGGNADTEEKVLQKFEQQVERNWAKREQSLRVKKRSQNWGVPTRRLWYE